jgi:NADPH-dependent 2,4-dienoyl-CoA reductase/sulfur reductase-like enzyme/nitrite reductase/ring-hydroxylating ferredoxin subunit
MEEMVGRVDELPDGALREIRVGGKKVLLFKWDGSVYAYGASCPHYGGPLPEGLLHDGRVMCPWHQGTFDARSGDLLEPPPFAGLPRYAVRIEDGAVYVDRPDDAPARRTMPMATADPRADERTFAIVGGGAAGAAAAEELRQQGFRGRIVLISREDRGPYDRPNLSKEYLSGAAPADWLPLRSASFYETHGIMRLHREVMSLDALTRRLVFDDGTDMTPDAVLVATGGLPRRLDVPGADLPRVFTLRSRDDCDRIIAATEGAARAVVVGASFIGMECAASLRQRGLAVAVVAPGEVPFERQLGGDVGRMLQRLHEEHEVRFLLGRQVAAFEGDDGVRTVALDDGGRLDADLVVMGVGVAPATAFIGNVTPSGDRSIDVDAELRVNRNGVWAAGDIARYPEAHVGGRARIEHWRLAAQHGRAAAASMAGNGSPFMGVPFFWTEQFGLRVSFAGVASGWDDGFAVGDVAARDFTAFYTRGGALVAASGTRDRDLAVFAELMRTGRLPAPDGLRGRDHADLERLL